MTHKLFTLFLHFLTIFGIDVPNSCINQQDTDNLSVHPIDDDQYPLLNVKCSNEYMIIDINKDKHWLSYFTSSRLYHYAVYGPEKDDHSNWNEWLLIPSISSYIVSPDCSSCDISSELNSIYQDSSSYYMTPTASQCTQIPISRIGCDMDYKSYECRVCETATTRQPGYWLSYPIYNGLNNDNNLDIIHNFNEIEQMKQYKYGLCMFSIRNANAIHNDDSFKHCKTATHEDLESEEIIPRRKPSIGSNGKFCVCIKPETFQIFDVDIAIQDEQEYQEYQEQIDGDISDKYELYQTDFIDGTYRISKPGTYILMEDIIFDFKAPEGYKEGTLDTYNGENDWWPTSDQIDEYPGAGDSKNSYFLGFWAGITIECNDVILDLNGYKLAMSEAFYYQQSFFALISLSSQIFLPGQGPGFFGSDPKFAENVIIRNGELGLSSHHGIQGNFNKNVLVENIKIHDFKTHGIQFNGFDGITIRNVDIGPNRKIDKLSPFYSQIRHLLSTYKRMRSENSDIVNNLCLTFYGRDECVTLNDLINDIQSLLDIAFEYAVFDKSIDIKAVGDDIDVLINNKESPQTATLYGIFLNYVGSNVIGWYAGSDSTKSHNILIENVKIHDLYHNTYENIGFSQGRNVGNQRIINCLSAPFNAYHIFGKEQVDKISHCNNYIDDNGDKPQCIKFNNDGLQYIGNKIVDIQIFAFKLINDYGLSWNYCSGGAADMNALNKFAFDNIQFLQFTPLLVASHDPMIHPGKGVIALRLNGINNGELNNINIENIQSGTDIGTLLGGKYENIVSQQAPYMNGYSMNMVNGLSLTFSKNIILNNIKLNKLISNTGLSYGLALWYDTEIKIVNNDINGITMNNIYAGKELIKSDKFTDDSYPNLKPEACGIRIYDDDLYHVIVNYENGNDDDINNINIQCIFGHTGCLMDDALYSHIGYVNNDQCQLLQQQQQQHTITTQQGIRYLFILLIIIVSVVTLIYYFCNYLQHCYHKRSSLNYSELTPLL